jgi:hypothetical protein
LAVAIAVAGAAYWFIRLHTRADAATVQRRVAQQYPGSQVGCLALQGNGSAWTCAVTYRAESACVAVSVSALGAVKSKTAPRHRCDTPQLNQRIPTATTTGVAADVTRIVGGTGRFSCATGISKGATVGSVSHWACLRGTDCRLLRVAPWTAFKLNNGAQRCRKVPALRHSTRS